MFADDVKIDRPICGPISDFPALQDDLDSFSEWSRAWHLGVSHENCTLFHVNFHRKCFLRVDGHRLSADVRSP